MPKKLPIEKVKAAVQEYKSKFTPGFYHGSPSPNIKDFDPLKNTDPMKLETPGVTFVTRDPDFAESFLPMSNRGAYKSGATMYPVSVNLGKHWHPKSKEGQQVLEDYLKKMYPYEANPEDLVDIKKQMSKAKWTDIENPNFLQFLRDTGHDTFHVMEGGIHNVGVLKPQNIRGKFAEFNPEYADSPDFMKAQGGLVHLAGAGSVAKAVVKQLPKHGETVNFVHYSRSPTIRQLDPSFYGKGIKGAEAERLNQAPDIKPRSYFYKDTPNVRPEPGLGPYKYQGTATNIYPLHSDPEELRRMAKEMSMDEYLASQGIQQVNQSQYLNNLERMIKERGYSGYASGDTGLLFEPIDVLPVK